MLLHCRDRCKALRNPANIAKVEYTRNDNLAIPDTVNDLLDDLQSGLLPGECRQRLERTLCHLCQ